MLSPDELDARAEALRAIEDATSAGVSEILGPLIRRLLAVAVALWPGDDAPVGVQREALERLNVESLIPAMARVQARIRSGADEAFKQGLVTAEQDVLAAVGKTKPLPKTHAKVVDIPPKLVARIESLEAVARSKALKASVLLAHSTELEDVIEAVTVVKQTETVSKMVAATTVHEASNEAVTSVSHANPDIVSIWRAERDACLHCLAYQGYVDIGDGYPGGLTFGRKPLHTERVSGPPLHPWCRCVQVLIHASTVADVADGLKREAARSVLRGWSLPSESNKARLDAAKRLLTGGTSLPKSVQTYARQAIKRGRFERGRRPPT